MNLNQHVWSDLALVRTESAQYCLEEQGEQDRVKIIQRWYVSVLLAPRIRPYVTVNYFIEIKLNPTGTEFVTSTAILSPSEQIFTPWMEILLDLDRCKSTTTFPKSMLSIRNRLTPSLSRGTILFPLSPHFSTGPKKQDIGLMPFISSSYQIKNNFLFRILSLVSVAIRVNLRSRSDHISDRYGYISPST
jgi:hypothetical protein